MIARGELSPESTRRILWVRRVFALLSLLLLVFLFDMQVLRRDEYRALAQLNSMRRVPVPAPRGVILDRDGKVLVKSRPAFDAVVEVDRVVDVQATLARARAVLAVDGRASDRLRQSLRARERPELVVKEDLSLAQVAALEARAYEWPEFRVTQSLVRSYPHGSSAAHALGYMGEIHEEQLADSAYRDYAPGEVLGQAGVEARYERYLRGRDGARRVIVNARGREIRAVEGIDPPRPGLDLHLTLDLDVQRAGEEAFGAQRGAAVALDLTSGAVLALISRPAYDPNAFAGKLSGDEWHRYRSDPAHPLFDRALLGRLPPGSVFKVIDSVAGLEDRVWDLDQPVTCNGRTVVHGDVFRCWKAGGHGTVRFHEALRGSCNVFFYHRGDQLGIERIARWSRRLGLGERTGIDLDPEGKGLVPDPTWKRRTQGQPWWPGETVSVAIGQGALGVSVLQIATVMGVVATGGRAHEPYVVESVGSERLRRTPVVTRQVPLRPDTLARLQRALWAVVNEPHGTGGRARIDGFDVCGKTGTAQAVTERDGLEAKEHAWFAGYAPGREPRFVAAVFVEHGGHGGEAAAPIARALLARALEKAGLKPEEAVAPEASLVAHFIGPPPLAAAAGRTASLFIGPPGLTLAASRPRVEPAVSRRGRAAVTRAAAVRRGGSRRR